MENVTVDDKVPVINLEDFVKIAGVKKSTVIKNKDKIPGLYFENGEYIIIEGTRYICDLHRYKLNNSEKKRFVLLKTIGEYKYISHIELGLYMPQFEDMLRELLSAGLIRANNMANKFGANFYDITLAGEEILRKKQLESIKEISDIVSESAGKFIGAIISKVVSQ